MIVEIEKSSGLAVYEVPVKQGWRVMDVLDYVYGNLDHTLAYYRHSSCCQAVCGRCVCSLNGQVVLACGKEIDVNAEKLHIGPANKKVIRDLVVEPH